MNERDEKLGLDRPITRRDFLQGSAIAIGAGTVGAMRAAGALRGTAEAADGRLESGGRWPPPGVAEGPGETTAGGVRRSQGTEPPPFRQGLRGQAPDAMALGHRVRDGDFRELPRDLVETGETYDLVVVGAGIAGLGAAVVFDQESPGEPSILILDNHDDFGGHARRNVMEYEGTSLIAAGGTFALEDPDESPPEALEIFRRIGLDVDRLAEYRDPGFDARFGLSPAVVFDSRVFGGGRAAGSTGAGAGAGAAARQGAPATTRRGSSRGRAAATWVTGWGEIPYEEFFAAAPLDDAARRDLIELYTTRRDYLPNSEDLRANLSGRSWERYVRETMGLGDAAVHFVNLYATDLGGLGADAVSAWHGYQIGPGFFGMGGRGFVERDGLLRHYYDPSHRFPDGNHTIARMLLRAVLPEALPDAAGSAAVGVDALAGGDPMETAFTSRVRYGALDRPDSRVRLRLSSMAVRLENRNGGVDVTYTRPDGRLYRVRARHAVMAGWGAVAQHVVPELGADQRRALEEYRYTSALYINVLLRHWRPIADIGARQMYWPGGYCTWMEISDPLHVGDYRPDYRPDRPTILSPYKYLYRPGLPPERQMQLGRFEMEHKQFAAYEREIREELNHLFGEHGFDAAQDIVGLTINRWGHGYNFFIQPGAVSRLDDPPYRHGRQPVGRISFAGADAGGIPWTQTALAQAWRAAHERLDHVPAIGRENPPVGHAPRR